MSSYRCECGRFVLYGRCDHGVAAARYRTDIRFVHLVQQAAGRVMHDHAETNSTVPEREAYDSVIDACGVILEMVYKDDAELEALRTERDAYKKLCEEMTMRSPFPPIPLAKP